MEWNHFMTILLLDPYFKINGWIYKGIMRVLVKKIIKSNFILSHSFQFGGIKIWDFKKIERNEYSLLSILFPPLKLPNKEISFSFSLLKFSNKVKEEYFKIIIFISFHFILFPLPKQDVKYSI